MIYTSFFNECLVYLYFKKMNVLGGFQGEKFSFKDTKTFLVKSTTKVYLNNLCIIGFLIRFSKKFKDLFVNLAYCYLC